MGQAAFLPNLFFSFQAMTTIFTPINRLYLAALAGADLDILFMGVDLEIYTYTHNYSINNIVSGSHYTHIIDELIIYGHVCSQIFYLCEMMHSLDVCTVFEESTMLFFTHKPFL